MVTIKLAREKETLLVPLLSKAVQTRGFGPILEDHKAKEILGRIDYDFSRLKVPKQSLMTLVIRAKKLDEYVRQYLTGSERPLVLHLGCGLDSRILRIGFKGGYWYDLDYPDVIELRKNFFEETGGCRMISSSVTDFSWMDQIKEAGPAFIIAEGLLMYLRPEDVRELVERLQSRFPHSIMAFDAYSLMAVKRLSRHPSLKKTGAEIRWGIDDLKEIEAWGKGIRVLEEWFFTDSEDIKDFSFRTRLLFRLAGMFKPAKKAHRIIKIQL